VDRELPQHPPLPVPVRRERGDAAANRARILAAARALVAEHGAAGVSMDAVAAAAGVGKGTIFRRFGDRRGLMQALVDDYMRAFQDAILSGPPPLGPGASPAARLEAFVVAAVRLQHEHLPLALAAEVGSEGPPPGASGALFLHVRVLVQALDPALDADAVAAMVLGAVAPPVLELLRHRAVDADVIAASAVALLRGLTG
jgi:AcrR family transcriptional regulator